MPAMTWEEIEPVVENAFSISTTGDERYWARYAWQILTDARLTEDQGGLGWHRVLIRLLALAAIYSDWCDVAWGQGYSDPQYAHWIEDLDISAFRIGQLVGAEQDDGDDEVDDSALVRNALARLADEARHDVFTALRDHFGSESELFVSLWRSTDFEYLKRQYPALADLRLPPSQYWYAVRNSPYPHERDETDEDECWEPSDDATAWGILNDVTDEKLQAFAWIDQGCQSFR